MSSYCSGFFLFEMKCHIIILCKNLKALTQDLPSFVKLRSIACHPFLLNNYLKPHLHFDNARGQTQAE